MNLFIDTTTKYVSIITFDQDQIISAVQYLGNNDHTTSIYEHLSKLNLEEIESIYVPIGPGSYTGVRIGVLVAKTLAHTLNAKLYTINTLKLFYSGLNRQVALDARGKKYFKYDGQNFSQIGYDQVCDEVIIDFHLDPAWLLDSKVLTKFELSDPLTLQIEYLKDAI